MSGKSQLWKPCQTARLTESLTLNSNQDIYIFISSIIPVVWNLEGQGELSQGVFLPSTHSVRSYIAAEYYCVCLSMLYIWTYVLHVLVHLTLKYIEPCGPGEYRCDGVCIADRDMDCIADQRVSFPL